MTWFGGVYQEPGNSFPQFAVNPEEYLEMYPEFLVSERGLSFRGFSTKAQSHNQGGQVVEEYSGYVGLDVHKETISPALANPGRSKPESLRVIVNTKKSILNLVHRLSREGEVLGFCYEAGPFPAKFLEV